MQKRLEKQLEELAESMGLSLKKLIARMKAQYAAQKKHAVDRGVAFELTLEEWMEIWCDSGKYHLRGRTRGCYVMCRTADIGPYAVGNVRIDTHAGNNLDTRGRISGPLKKFYDSEQGHAVKVKVGLKLRTNLTPAQELEVRELRASGMTHRKIAETTGVPLSAVGNICRGKWATVSNGLREKVIAPPIKREAPLLTRALVELENPLYQKNGKLDFTRMSQRTGIGHLTLRRARKLKEQK